MKTRLGPRWPRSYLRLALVVVALAVVCGSGLGIAWARPGGGSSFSGSGGGGSGNGDVLDLIFLIIDLLQLIVWLIELTIEYPKVMLIVWAVLGGVVLFAALANRKKRDWSVGSTGKPPAAGAPIPPRVRSQVPALSYAPLLARDPDFSPIVLEDFLYALYAEAHGARSPQRAAELAAYLSPSVRSQLDALHGNATEVAEVVIGSVRFERLTMQKAADGKERARLTVTFETNYTERAPSGPRGFWSRETWTLERAATARSRPPARARIFECPNCGAPLSSMKGSTCSHCQQVVDSGEFDWIVTDVAQEPRQPRGPMLETSAEERGSDLPTLVDARCDEALATLQKRDPAFDRASFEARIKRIFTELQAGWSTRDWKRIRPYLTDALFQMQLGYLEAYLRAGLRNVTEKAEVAKIEIVKVSSDRYYDAITVRLFASSTDYVVSDSGKLVSGSRTALRRYTEYWTLVRGVDRTGAARSEATCPNCGAALQVNMTGTCKYCSVRVSCGEFDWSLSRIEQDEVYAG